MQPPPFYAMKAHQGLDMIGGGIRISPRMEVLDRELKPIGGLCARGLVCSGWFGFAGEGTGGCCLSFMLCVQLWSVGSLDSALEAEPDLAA